jgi:hypothetical protein
VSVFRHRGLRPVIDTTAQAEFDFAGIPVPPAVQDRIGQNLLAMPISPRDVVQGHLRVREVEGFMVLFFLERSATELVITLGGVVTPDPEESTEAFVARILKAAMSEPARVLLEGKKGKTP